MIENIPITSRFIKNVSYSTVNYVWPILLAFFALPIIINSLGVAQYGYYIFMLSVTGIVGLLDLGVTTSIIRSFSEKIGEANKDELKRYIGVAKFIFLNLATIGFVFFLTASLASYFILNGKYAFLAVILLISGILFFVDTIESTFTASIVANQRFDIYSKIGVTTITIQQILLMLVAYYTQNITLMFAVHLLVTLIGFLMSYLMIRKSFPEINSKILYDLQIIKRMYLFGIRVFLVGLFNSLLNYFDKLLIPILLGARSLTYYSVPGTISSKIPSFAGPIGGIIFPMISNFEGSGDKGRQKILYEKSIKAIMLVSLSIGISVIAYSKEILGYWINFEVAENSHVVLILLILTSIPLALYHVLSNFLFGFGKTKKLIIITALMAVLNLIFLFILLPPYGIIGAAIAYLLSVLPILFLKVHIDKQYFDTTFKKEDAIILIKVFTAAAVTLAVSIIGMKPWVNSLATVIVAFGISNIIFMFLIYLSGIIHRQEKDLINRHILFLRAK